MGQLGGGLYGFQERGERKEVDREWVELGWLSIEMCVGMNGYSCDVPMLCHGCICSSKHHQSHTRMHYAPNLPSSLASSHSYPSPQVIP